MEGDSKQYVMQIPYYLIPNIDSTEITADLIQDNRYILMPAAQAIKTLDSYRDTLTIEPILSTSEKAYIKQDVENMKNFQKEDGDEEGTFQLGVKVEETVDEVHTTRIAYASSSSILDQTTNQQVSGGNTELVLDTLGWMCENNAPVITVDSKSLMMSYLTIPEYDAGYWAAITCGILQAEFHLVGAVVWFMMRKL